VIAADQVEGLGPAPTMIPELPEALRDMPRGDLMLAYQQKAILLGSTSPLFVLEKSRRVGMTWAWAALAVLTAGVAVSAGGMDVNYTCYDKEITREFIEACAMFVRAFSIAAGAVHETVIDDDEGKPIQVWRIEFASGFKILALPGVARAMRGRQGLAIIDEAAFISNLEEMLKAVLAFLMWGGRVIVNSTHNGVSNAFNKLLDEIKAGTREGVTWKITFADAVAAGLYERVALLRPSERALGKEGWINKVRRTYGANAAEELDCIPKTGDGSWLDLASVVACEHPEAGRPELYGGGWCYAGWDVARRRHLSVIWVYEIVREVAWLRQEIEMRNMPFKAQYAAFDQMVKDYRLVRARLDQTGMGEAVVEQVQEKHGLRAEGMLLTGPARLDQATIFRQRFDDGLIRIRHDPLVRSDLTALKKISVPGGGVRLVEEGEHPDRFWAGALAAGAAHKPYQRFEYEAAGRPRGALGDSSDDDDDRPRRTSRRMAGY